MLTFLLLIKQAGNEGHNAPVAGLFRYGVFRFRLSPANLAGECGACFRERSA
ncbi:hypothetical protein J2T20_004728 [Paenibacillus wynnii]|nr:hypothetical protein [Paenibacillus wynnii]